MVIFKEIVGLDGVVVTVIANTRAVDGPHALLAVTEMLPPVALATPVMEAVVDVPVQPPGKVHV